MKCWTASRTPGHSGSIARDTCGEDRRTRAGQWQRFVPLDIAGSTLGIVGLGKLGSQVAKIAHAFGMEVLAWRPHLTPQRAATHHATRVELDELLDHSQILTLHVPLSDGSRGLIGPEELRRLGTNGYLVYASRGPIVDQDALVQALHAGTIAGRAGRFRCGADTHCSARSCSVRAPVGSDRTMSLCIRSEAVAVRTASTCSGVGGCRRPAVAARRHLGQVNHGALHPPGIGDGK